MKKWITGILLITILLMLLSVSAFAAETEKPDGVWLDWTTTNDVEHPTGYYYTEKHLEEMPTSFEVWVKLPQDIYAEGAGIILSNSKGNDHSFDLAIAANGVPQLVFRNIQGDVFGCTYDFVNSAIPADTWTHIAVVYGMGTDNKQVACYINGEQRDITQPNYWYETDSTVTDNFLCLAGSFVSLNKEAFKGQLGDMAVYTDVRTTEEIRSDMNNKPDTQDPALMFYYALFETEPGMDVVDVSGNGYDMSYGRMWLTEEEMQQVYAADDKEYAYSIAFLPDIQHSTRLYPDKLQPIVDYLLENKESKNIQYVIGLGDMTDSNEENEWQIVKDLMDQLNDKLPYSLIRGNHDILYNNDKNTLLHDQYFSNPADYYYQHVKENGGFYNEKSTINTYLLFSVGKVDYMILNLDFGASDDILAWADTVLEEHKNRRAIVVTHGYLNHDGTYLDKNDSVHPSQYMSFWNDGDGIWEKMVKKHANIDMVVCGHIGADNIVCTKAVGDNGNEVYQLLMDTQSTDNELKGLGIVGMMYFTEDGRFAKVEYYSTVLERYFHETNVNVQLDFGEDPATVNWLTVAILSGAAVIVVAAVTVTIICKKKKNPKCDETTKE